MKDLANVCEALSRTSSKNEKIRILAGYLKQLDDKNLAIACMYLSNNLPYLKIGHNNIWQVIEEVTSIDRKSLEDYYIRYGDLGRVTEVAIEHLKVKPLIEIQLTLEDVNNILDKIADIKGSNAMREKKDLLKGLLINSSPLEAKYLVKIILNELRIGVEEGILEGSIASAFGKDLEDVRRCILLNHDIAAIALAAKYDRLNTIKMEPLKPVSYMLADTVYELDDGEYIVEFKYDGIRAQLHKKDSIKIFSRKLEDISNSFPELNAVEIDHDLILDGEIIALRGSRSSFNELQRRIMRKSIDDDIMIKYIVYDILYLDGNILIDLPLRDRKSILESLRFNEPIELAPYRFCRSRDEVYMLLKESRMRGHEGLILKVPYSKYNVGKRERLWLKLKHATDTLDVVIVAAEYGHGKRAMLLSDYTFAVSEGNELRVIGKAYSGLRDDEIEEMTTRLKEIMIRDEGRRIIVEPMIVLEVTFDSISRSNRYNSNFALRFPRIKRIRYDKSVNEIDTLDKVRELYQAMNRYNARDEDRV